MDTLQQLWKPVSEPRDGMTAAQYAVQRDALRAALTRMDAIKVTCHFCASFELGKCEKHGAVPLEFQKSEGACAEWTYDGVPF
jgi:hypothetical protein